MSRGFIFGGCLTQSLKHYFYHLTFCAGLFPVQSLFLKAFYDDSENYSGLWSLVQGYFQSLEMKKDLIDLKKKD